MLLLQWIKKIFQEFNIIWIRSKVELEPLKLPKDHIESETWVDLKRVVLTQVSWTVKPRSNLTWTNSFLQCISGKKSLPHLVDLRVFNNLPLQIQTNWPLTQQLWFLLRWLQLLGPLKRSKNRIKRHLKLIFNPVWSKRCIFRIFKRKERSRVKI